MYWRVQSWWVREKSIWKARLRAEPTSPEHTRCRPTNPPILPAGRRTLCISADRLCRWCPRRTATPITLSLAVGGLVQWLIVRMARMSYWMFGRTSGLNTSCFRQTDWPLAFDISVAADCHWFTIMSPGHIRQVYGSRVTRRWRDVETWPDTGRHYVDKLIKRKTVITITRYYSELFLVSLASFLFFHLFFALVSRRVPERKPRCNRSGLYLAVG